MEEGRDSSNIITVMNSKEITSLFTHTNESGPNTKLSKTGLWLPKTSSKNQTSTAKNCSTILLNIPLAITALITSITSAINHHAATPSNM